MNREKFYISVGLLALSLAMTWVIWPSSSPDFAYSTHNYNPPPGASLVIPEFRERSLELGLDASHRESYEYLNGLEQTLGGGACVLDFNNDGWFDLFIVAGSGQVQTYGKSAWWSQGKSLYLFKNQEGRAFEDVTPDSGLPHVEKGMGCAAGDLDNDGFVDVFVTSAGENRILKNTGTGTFQDVTDSSGISGEGWSTSAVIADFDQDGLQDIYVTNYIDFEKGGRRFESNSGFERLVPGDLNPALFDPIPNRLYRNMGGMAFSDETEVAGVADSSGRGLSVQSLDADADGWQDLLIVNHSGSPNRLYINDQAGGFRDVSDGFGVSSVSAGQASTVADFNHDGFSDVFVSADQGYLPALAIRKPDSLRFIDELWSAGLGLHSSVNSSGWGAIAQDFNNDGTIDVFVNNGLIVPDADSPSISQGQPNHLWYRRADGQFSVGEAPGQLSGRGAVSLDYNNDGDLDLLLINNNDPVELWENQGTGNHWLGVSVHGGASARSDFALIEVHTAEGVYRKISGAQSTFLSQSDPRTVFGLGSTASVEQVVVQWNDGTVRSVESPQVDQYLVIHKNGQVEHLDYSKVLPGTSYNFQKLHPDFLPHYARWLASSVPSSEKHKELLALYKSSDPAVRKSLLQEMEEVSGPAVLPILQLALESDRAEEIMAGLGLAERLESERSIKWLLPLLSDSAPDEIRCKTASVFEHFFREEEAVVHRKMQAVTHLVRILENEQSEFVLSCSLRALAESEHYRALGPTIELARTGPIPIRENAVKTLGMLRERAALPALEEILLAEEVSPSLRAKALVAMFRLGVDPFRQGFASSEFRHDSPTRQRDFLKTIGELRANGDAGLVIDYGLIQLKLQEFLEKTPLSADSETIQLAAETIAQFRNPGAVSQLNMLISDNREARQLILASAMRGKLLREADSLIDHLMKLPVGERNRLLERSETFGLAISDEEIAVSESLSSEQFEFLLTILDFSHPVSQVRRALNLALSKNEKRASIQYIALKQCSRLGVQGLNIPDSLLYSRNDEERSLALDCLSRQKMPESVQKRMAVIRDIATNPTSRLSERYAAVRAITSLRPRDMTQISLELVSDAQSEEEFLVLLATSLAEQQDLKAAPIMIRALLSQGSSLVRSSAIQAGLKVLAEPLKSQLLAQVMTNKDEARDNRIKAAGYLLTVNPEEVLAVMMNNQGLE